MRILMHFLKNLRRQQRVARVRFSAAAPLNRKVDCHRRNVFERFLFKIQIIVKIPRRYFWIISNASTVSRDLDAFTECVVDNRRISGSFMAPSSSSSSVRMHLHQWFLYLHSFVSLFLTLALLLLCLLRDFLIDD